VGADLRVELKPEESQESLLRRFTKGVALDGTLRIYRERMRFMTKRERLKKKSARAARRSKKKSRAS
jgi:ribosomal protein S21